MKLKSTLILIAVIAFAFIAGAIAAHIIKSPDVTVTVENYTLTINANATTIVLGDTINFSGTLSSPSFVVENQNITLYCNNSFTGLWSLTDSSGAYSILWTPVAAGTSTFYTQAEIT